MPLPPLGKQDCRSQKHAVELLSTPNSRRCSSSVAPSGNLITGADCLKTFPPRSSTKWLCVATNANVIDSGVRYRCGTHRYHVHHGSCVSCLVWPPKPGVEQ